MRHREQQGSVEAWPSWGATAALLGALLVPFGVLAVSGEEILPSVIFPGGGGTVPVQDNVVSFQATTYWAYSLGSGDLEEVDPRRLLAPVPVQFAGGVADQLFALEVESDDELSEWLRQRLSRLGLDDQVLVVRRTSMEGLLPSGATAKRAVNAERVIYLR